MLPLKCPEITLFKKLKKEGKYTDSFLILFIEYSSAFAELKITEHELVIWADKLKNKNNALQFAKNIKSLLRIEIGSSEAHKNYTDTVTLYNRYKNGSYTLEQLTSILTKKRKELKKDIAGLDRQLLIIYREHQRIEKLLFKPAKKVA